MQQRNEIADKSADHNSISRQKKFPKPIFLLHLCNSEWTPKKEKNPIRNPCTTYIPPWYLAKGLCDWHSSTYLLLGTCSFCGCFPFYCCLLHGPMMDVMYPMCVQSLKKKMMMKGAKQQELPWCKTLERSPVPLCCWVSMCQVGGGVGPNDFCAAEE